MGEAGWERIKATFEAVMAVPAEERPAVLDRECGGDADLRREVESLLAVRTQALVRTAGAARSLATAAPASATERAGEVIGRYRLLEPLGEGGFGTVWMADQLEPVKRRVALKVIKLGMDTRQVIARFEAERQALALMDHPNIAKVFDAGTTAAGRPYFVMEYIRGVPILEYCDEAALDTRARLGLFTRVCQALQHAHQKGVIHRDVKPSNVLVTLHDGVPVPKVIDFGIAKATSAELTTRTLFTEHKQMIGTPAYMSPEQAELSGLDVDTRSDVYSLGVLLYELLTGTTPFDRNSLWQAGLGEMMRIIREVEPPKPSTRLSSLGETGARTAQQRRLADVKQLGTLLRGDLDWIVMKCLEKDRTRRYESASALAADIQRHLADEPVVAAAPGAGYRLRKFVRRHRARVIAGCVVAVALVLGVIGTTWGLVWALDEKAKATRAAESEAQAKVAAQENERKAVAASRAAEAAKEEESKARRRAETISAFVTTALQSSDGLGFEPAVGSSESVGTPAAGAPGALHDMTILAAMDNALRDIDSGRFRDDPETEAALRGTIGVILRNNAKYEKAKPLLERALVMRERALGADALLVASSANDLAEVYHQLGRYDEAETLFRRAVTILEGRGKEDSDLARALNNLAIISGTQGRFDRAEPLLKRALAIREKLFAPDDPEIANGVSNLAVFYGTQERYAEAAPLHERALAIREKALGPDNPDTANSLSNLAWIRAGQGRTDEAQALYARALAIYERALGREHPLVANTLGHMGSLQQAQGRYARARKIFERALAIDEKVYGPDHPTVAFRLVDLALLYQAQGERDQVGPLLQRAVAIRKAALPADHPDLAAAMDALGQFHFAAGRYDETEPLFTGALAIREKVLPPGHSELAVSVNNVAALRYAQGRYSEAEPMLMRALALREKALGPNHAEVAASCNNLAMLFAAQGRLDRADEFAVRALAIYERAMGADNPATATSLNNLGTLRVAQNRAAEAEPLFVRALSIFEKVLGTDHPTSAQSLIGLARAHQALGKTAEARREFDRALPTLRRLSPGSPTLAQVLWASAEARLAGGDAAAALPEVEEAVAIAEKTLASDHPHLKDYRETLAKVRAAIAK